MQSMNSVRIHSQEVTGGSATILASIYRKPGSQVDVTEFRAELQRQAQNKMYALAGSFTVVDEGPQRLIVRGHMVPAREILPFKENMQGFSSLSRNVYQDEEEQMWSLKQVDGGQFLIRANVIDDPAEIQSLMQSCSSDVASGTDRIYFASVSKAHENAASVSAGDAVLYAHSGDLRFGVVMASVSSEEGQDDTLLVFNHANDTVDVVGREQIALASEVGTQVPAATLVIPEHIQCPNLQMAAAASEQSTAVNALVDYWKKVWGYGPDYFAAFENIIRGHTFA